MKEFLDTQKKLIGIILVTSILFARCNLGITYSKWFVLINLLVNGLAFLYCLWLGISDKATMKKAIFNPAIAWILFFSAIVMIYGHFQIRDGADYYSRQMTVLTIVPAIIILILLYLIKEDVINIISISGSIVIISTLIVSLLYDPIWAEWLTGRYARVGATPSGGDIDTGNLVLILLLPVFYQLIVNRKIKYAFIALIGLFEIIGTGSKSAVFPLVFVFAIMIIGSSNDKKVIRRRLLILVILAVVAITSIMIIPPLYGVIGYRIVELFTGLSSQEIDLKTSTGQRMAQIAAFKEHFGEYPIFGHGYYAFKEMPYSAIEAVRLDDSAKNYIYQHVQLHMNYLEVLFSFGIFGFVSYYWLPVYTLIKSIKANKIAKIMVPSIMVSMFFVDLGLDVYYRYLVPYYAYFLAYHFVENGKDNEE